MKTISYATVQQQARSLWPHDTSAGGLFLSMVIGYEQNTFPSTCTERQFQVIADVLGARFLYVSKDDQRAGREPTLMLLCRLPLTDQEDVAPELQHYRIYMVPESIYKFFRTLIPACPVRRFRRSSN